MYKRFNSNGTIDTTFNVVTTAGNTLGEVIVPDYYGKILIGGNEHSINGKSPSGNFAKLNQDGTTSSCEETVTYTYYLSYTYSGTPCDAMNLAYDIYEGSDGKYYADQGGTYVLASSISSMWFIYSYTYNDGLQDRYVYDRYNATNGNFVISPVQLDSACEPFSLQ